MAQVITRNGKEFTFPDNFSQEQIDKFFIDLEGTNQEDIQEEKPEEE